MTIANIAIIKSEYRSEVVDLLVKGSASILEQNGAVYEVIEVTGALEIPQAMNFMLNSSRSDYQAYIALGCILKGETIHDEVIAYSVFKALDKLSRKFKAPFGNGILTTNTLEQAIERASPDRQNRGGEAAKAALKMLEIKGLYDSI
jgi:6,7-dimethyl-8-ribityllumazine synthase